MRGRERGFLPGQTLATGAHARRSALHARLPPQPRDPAPRPPPRRVRGASLSALPSPRTRGACSGGRRPLRPNPGQRPRTARTPPQRSGPARRAAWRRRPVMRWGVRVGVGVKRGVDAGEEGRRVGRKAAAPVCGGTQLLRPPCPATGMHTRYRNPPGQQGRRFMSPGGQGAGVPGRRMGGRAGCTCAGENFNLRRTVPRTRRGRAPRPPPLSPHTEHNECSP